MAETPPPPPVPPQGEIPSSTPPPAQPPAQPPAPVAKPPAPRPPERHKSVIIRSRPKVVFLYPTLLAALVAGLWTWFAMRSGVPLDQVTLTPGRIFFWTFAINLAAMAFDFTRGEFVALILFFGVCILGTFMLDERFGFVTPIRVALSHVKLVAHPHLYLLLAGALGATYAIMILNGRFDYWELTHNELKHHRGLLGDIERYPAPNLRLTKEITDVFEYFLLGSGRLVLQPQGAARAITLENVLLVDRIEGQIQTMLSQLAVTIEKDEATS
jgi:hypothetical protein